MAMCSLFILFHEKQKGELNIVKNKQPGQKMFFLKNGQVGLIIYRFLQHEPVQQGRY